MNFFAVFLTALMIVSTAYAQSPDFRDFVWGVTQEDVRRYEKASEYKEVGESLYFVEEAEGDLRRVIRYDFVDGALARIETHYPEYHETNPDPVLDKIASETAALNTIYGAPAREELIWNNEAYQYYPQFWGRALRNGDLRIVTTWETPQTNLRLESFHDGDFYQIRTIAEDKARAGQSERDEGGLLLLAP